MVLEKIVTLIFVSENYTWSGKTTIFPIGNLHPGFNRPFIELKNIRHLIYLSSQKGQKLTDDDVKKGTQFTIILSGLRFVSDNVLTSVLTSVRT